MYSHHLQRAVSLLVEKLEKKLLEDLPFNKDLHTKLVT